MNPVFKKAWIVTDCKPIDPTNLPTHNLSCLHPDGNICCVACGHKATHVVYWRHKNEPKSSTHLDFFHMNPKNGSMHLMTKDHILPRSFLGADKLTNYRVMCSKCNETRATNVTDEEWRQIFNEPKKYVAPYRIPGGTYHPLKGWLQIIRQFPELGPMVSLQ